MGSIICRRRAVPRFRAPSRTFARVRCSSPRDPGARITLFLFGGVSEIEREPDSPRAEFLIAVVGPLTSLALAGLCAIVLALIVDGEAAQDPSTAITSLGVFPTLLAWLGPINLLLAVFNLIPGFPLDGGRVLRAALWQITGSLRTATRWAAGAGQAFGWLLVAVGVLEIAFGMFQGLWLILIGWFLAAAARRSNADVVAREVLAPLRVRDLMRTRFEVVDADLPLDEFVRTRLLRTAQTTWPVTSSAGLVGLVSIEQVSAVPEARRGDLRVGDVSVPVPTALGPDVGGREAARVLAQPDADVIPVIRDRDLVGLLHRGDVARWVALHDAA